MKLYLERLDSGLPLQSHILETRQRGDLLGQIKTFLQEKMNGAIDPEIQDEPSLRGWVTKILAVTLTLAFAIAILILAQTYEVGLPDMFMPGMLLLVVAFIITISML